MKKLLSAIAASILIISCGESTTQSNATKIVCTTGVIADAIQNIVPASYSVEAMMGPGVDPHTYKSKSSDLKNLLKADAIIYNGIHFEANLIDAIDGLKKKQFVISLGDIVPQEKLRSAAEFGDAHDPHFWHDVNLFRESISLAANQLKNQFKSDSAYIDSAANVYLTQLTETEQFVKTQMALIPDSSRVMITAHDAFGYFGRAFNIEVKGVQGISTSSDISIRGIKELTDFIVARKIPAIFVENSVSEKNIKSVAEGCEAKGHTLKQGGTLYSDGLGDAESGADTYINMIKKNTETIVSALK